MLHTPTTLLYHAMPGRPHWDWLFPNPEAAADPTSRLRTFRCDHHWDDWQRLGRVELTALPDHRSRYLHWQGTLTDGRGWVRQDGRGWMTIHRSAEPCLLMSLNLPGGSMEGRLLQIADDRWMMTMV
jgi:hypothetical protein